MTISSNRAVAVLLAAVATFATAPAALAQTPPEPLPTDKILSYHFVKQDLNYNCGPTATQIALTTWNIHVSVAELGSLEGTTTDGTNDISNVVYGLNTEVKRYSGQSNWYRVVRPTSKLADGVALKNNALYDIGRLGRGFVVNVKDDGATQFADSRGTYHSWPAGHYMAVVGYAKGGDLLLVADNGDGTQYWMNPATLARWIAFDAKGYAI